MADTGNARIVFDLHDEGPSLRRLRSANSCERMLSLFGIMERNLNSEKEGRLRRCDRQASRHRGEKRKSGAGIEG
jgi:hypothetical protein